MSGLSYSLGAFQHNKEEKTTKYMEFPVTPCKDYEELCDRELTATSRLRGWCRGLVEPSSMPTDGYGLPYAKFSHRTIPEYLSDKLEDLRTRFGIGRDLMIKGLLTIFLADMEAESLMGYHGIDSLGRFKAMLSATATDHGDPQSHFLMLDDYQDARRRAQPSGYDLKSLTISLKKLHARSIDFDPSPPVFIIATSLVQPMIDYVTWALEKTGCKKDS